MVDIFYPLFFWFSHTQIRRPYCCCVRGVRRSLMKSYITSHMSFSIFYQLTQHVFRYCLSSLSKAEPWIAAGQYSRLRHLYHLTLILRSYVEEPFTQSPSQKIYAISTKKKQQGGMQIVILKNERPTSLSWTVFREDKNVDLVRKQTCLNSLEKIRYISACYTGLNWKWFHLTPSILATLSVV
jgi:hypothetical protein